MIFSSPLNVSPLSVCPLSPLAYLLKATTPSRVAKEMVPLPPYQESHVFVHLKQ